MTESTQRARAIFAQAVEIESPQERNSFLDQACEGDADIRTKVDSLLKAIEEADDFLAGADPTNVDTLDSEANTFDSAGIPVAEPRGTSRRNALAEKPGSMVGRYKLLQQIGEGGFGVVYMAEQEKPVKRRVALKVIKAGMDTGQVIARFEAERQALAMMDHPNIARVLDAGATDTGRPYFVMELVKGIPITDYCDEANLDTRQRLELFKDVCSAIQHAHQKGIIHRDLKPSNIMITLHDAKPVVKVIDFGIAKATDQKLTEKTLFTNYGQMIGTPTYMSPEQAVMSGLDVDTRSDVYALGVLLYELLAGSPPFDAQTLRTAGFDEMRRIIREQEPPKPSTRLDTLAQDVKLTVAAKRHASPAALSKQLHGDLDWIIMKALEKDRARRYESASAFAQDIERHLTAEPVDAAAPSAGYRLRKFAKRNKGPMTVAAAITLLLIGGTVISTLLALRANSAEELAISRLGQVEDERDRAVTAEHQARRRLTQIEKANEILGSIFKNLDPHEIAEQSRPLQTIIVEQLDKAIEQLHGDAVGDPLMVARMQHTIGESLNGLGEGKKAVFILEKSLATFKTELGIEDAETLKVMNQLALAYGEAGDRKRAVLLNEETLELRKTVLGPEHTDTLTSMNNLALTYFYIGDVERAIPIHEQTLKLKKAILGPDHAHTLNSMNNLALAYGNAGDSKRAIPLLAETVKLTKAKFGPKHPDSIRTMNNLAGFYASTGDVKRAIPLHEQALELYMATLGPEHPHTLHCMDHLVVAYTKAGDRKRELPLRERVLNIRVAKLGSAHPDTLKTMDRLASAYKSARYAFAYSKDRLAFPDKNDRYLKRELALREELFKVREAKFGPEHPDTLDSMTALGRLNLSEKRFEQAIHHYEQALKHGTASLGPENLKVVLSATNLAWSYIDANRVDEALPLLERADQAWSNNPKLSSVDFHLIRLYSKAGKAGKVIKVLDKLGDVWPKDADVQPYVAEKAALAGHLLLKGRWFEGAERVLRRCVEIREKIMPDHWSLFSAKSMLGEALLGQEKYTEAEPLLLAGYEGIKQREESILPHGEWALTYSLERLVKLYETRNSDGDAAKARMYKELLEEREEKAKE